MGPLEQEPWRRGSPEGRTWRLPPTCARPPGHQETPEDPLGRNDLPRPLTTATKPLLPGTLPATGRSAPVRLHTSPPAKMQKAGGRGAHSCPQRAHRLTGPSHHGGGWSRGVAILGPALICHSVSHVLPGCSPGPFLHLCQPHLGDHRPSVSHSFQTSSTRSCFSLHSFGTRFLSTHGGPGTRHPAMSEAGPAGPHRSARRPY